MPEESGAGKRPPCCRSELLEAFVVMFIVPAIIVVNDQREKHAGRAHKSGTHQPSRRAMKMKASPPLSRYVQIVYVDAERGIGQKGGGEKCVCQAFAQGEEIWLEVASRVCEGIESRSKANARGLGFGRASRAFVHRSNVNVTGDQCQVRPEGADAIGRPC